MECETYGGLLKMGDQECVSSLAVEADLSRLRGLQKTPKRVPSDDLQTTGVW